MPRGNNLYLCGSTYIHTLSPLYNSTEGKEAIVQGLSKIIELPYKIVEHRTAVRPTIKDRRPVLGKHPDYLHVSYFNGLGTKGVMLAPRFSSEMFNLLEHGIDPHPEVRLSRFY